ncbi:N-acetylglucosamine kinase [Allokutzneria albata]|uniref:BadF-type ATPase n=1 Tax=Allokutzneria albata TaxID=211114 RepID=A0A1H0ARG2_ALLAB|nr:BadF/BadG/BcrA/BcrD ATPase family protein [Allokutzneria albata]SDN36122.1 BadF-type ATPase [Allokutzneria albata]
MKAEQIVLAIDGGNSKTDVMLVNTDGVVLSRVRGPGASPQTVGVKESLDCFGELAARAARAAGLSGEAPFAAHTAAYLAGADLPREEELLSAAVSARGWSSTTVVANDTFALLRAGTSDGVGVAVVCGAGINAVGVAADGRTHRFPALGRISGDWGGGAQMGSEALWLAVRADDGRGESTELLPAVLAHFGASSMTEVIEGLHFGELDLHSAVHALSPVLFRVAADGDAVAARVVDRLAEEIGLLAGVSLQRLGLTGEQVPVVLGGGVLTGASGQLLAEVDRRCRAVAPLAELRLVDLPPVVGAALWGLDALGAGPAAEAALRGAALPSPVAA